METVKVRGKVLTIVKRESVSHLGPRYFGWSRWTLTDRTTGETFHACGKRLVHNSRIYAADDISGA